MNNKVSISIDVSDMDQAVNFYTQALKCELKKKYSDEWLIVTIAGLDIHLQKKVAGTIGAADQPRDYGRHWTPVHLDFTVDDIRQVCVSVEEHGGCVENKSFSNQADIAHCADPFGNGFCVIREQL